MSLNRFEFIGNLTADPEKKNIGEKNTCVVTLRLAVNRDRKAEGQPDADFFNITTFGKLAESCSSWLKKGRQVYVAGRIQPRTYTNKDGIRVSTTDYVASTVEFLRGGAGSDAEGAKAPVSSADDHSDEGFMTYPENDEDLPFIPVV